MPHLLRLSILLAACILLSSCQTAYYSTMEKLGIHKRDILVDRVEEARDSQHEAREQFASALDRFNKLMNFKGGELQDIYEKLKDELDESEARAEEVHERIAAVEDVAEDLFDEWHDELGQYSSSELRRSSERQLKQTRKSYQKLLRAMKKAEAKIEPVLSPLRDQVLFLKHNLNARAIASLKRQLHSIETDVSRLLRDMEASIREADEFIRRMEES